MKAGDIKTEGRKVYQKEYDPPFQEGVIQSYNWKCIATFHHIKHGIEPEDMATIFADALQNN